MNRLRQKYFETILPALAKEFGISIMAAPRIHKVTLNMGLGKEAVANSQSVSKALEQMSAIAGQKAVSTKARKAIATFKLRAGQEIGVMVTLRGDRMYAFLDRLLSVVLPRVRDFQGVPRTSFDKSGNYSMGLTEQTLFPEIDISKVDKIRGLQVTLSITSKSPEHSEKLLKDLGMPFKKED